MTAFEKAKSIISEHFEEGSSGLFNTRNWVGDPMETIYEDEDVCVDVCRWNSYFEVFGLSESAFEELLDWYEEQRKQQRKRW